MISSVFIHLKKRSDASDSLFTVGSDSRYPLLLVLLVFFLRSIYGQLITLVSNPSDDFRA